MAGPAERRQRARVRARRSPTMLTGGARAQGTPDECAGRDLSVNRLLWPTTALSDGGSSTSSSLTGAFTFPDLIAASISWLSSRTRLKQYLNDQKTLAMLSRTATRVTIDDGDRKSVDQATPGPIR